MLPCSKEFPTSTHWANVGHAFYVSEVDSNYNLIAAVAVTWGNANRGGQWLTHLLQMEFQKIKVT